LASRPLPGILIGILEPLPTTWAADTVHFDVPAAKRPISAAAARWLNKLLNRGARATVCRSAIVARMSADQLLQLITIASQFFHNLAVGLKKKE